VAADAVIGEYVAHTNGYDATIVALLQDPSGYCVGVSTSNTELQSAVSTVVKKLASGGVGDIIEAKWLGSALNLNNVTVVKGAATTGSASTTAGTTSTTGTAGSASATGSATSTGTTGTTTATGATGSTGATSTTAATGTTN
jgi:polar amino acid transport system substrate-binding protein